GVEALARGTPGERLRMVPGGDGDDACGTLCLREGRELGEDAPRLERAGPLEELRLQREVVPEAPRGEGRRPVEAACAHRGGALDVVGTDRNRAFHRSILASRPTEPRRRPSPPDMGRVALLVSLAALVAAPAAAPDSGASALPTQALVVTVGKGPVRGSTTRRRAVGLDIRLRLARSHRPGPRQDHEAPAGRSPRMPPRPPP